MSFNIGKDKLKGEREALRQAANARGPKDTNTRNAREILAMQAALRTDMDDEDDEGLELSEVEQMCQQAEEALQQLEFPTAKSLLEEASKLVQNNEEKAMVYDLIAQVLLEEGEDVPRAIAVLKEAESLTPNVNYERLVNLGQLTQEQESLGYYQQGLNVLQEQLNELGPKRKGEDPELTAMRAELLEVASTVLVSMSELYVTDLCDEECAERECERLLQEAVKASATNTEAFRALGNLRMIQGNKAQAAKYTQHAFKLLVQAAESGKPIPEFLARVDLAKQLLELESWCEATELFVTLLDEDENIAEIWYYAGIASINYGRSLGKTDEAYDLQMAAAQYFLQAQKILKQAPDQEMQDNIENQLRSLNENGISVEEAKKALRTAMTASGEGVDIDDIDSDNEMN